VDGLWETKSEGFGLIVRAVSFQDFQPMWSWWEADDMYHAIVPWDLTLCTTAREGQGTAAC